MREGQFPPGSMGPKVEAAIRFLEGGGKRAIIAISNRRCRRCAARPAPTSCARSRLRRLPPDDRLVMLHASDNGQQAMSATNSPLQRVAIAGFGAIGMRIARALDAGIPGYELAAVSAHDRDKAQKRLSVLSRTVPVVTIEELEPLADLVIECAPAALLPSIATPFLRNGKTVIVLSAGALLSQ